MLVRCGGLPDSMVVDDPELTLQDLGLDSASLLAVHMELERQLGIELTADDIAAFATLGGAIECINGKRRG